jgi:thioredoxin-like negative regulator of GroEL
MTTKFVFAVLVILASVGILTGRRANAESDLKADAVVVYSASWCDPCRRLKPVLAKLKSLGYKVYVRDYDKIKAGQFKPDKIPAVYLFRGTKLLKSKGLSSNSSLLDFRSKMIRP